MTANQTVDVTPVAVLPEFISETDLLRIELGQEKHQKFAAQKDALTLQLNQVTEQLTTAKANIDRLILELTAKYKVSGQDTYDKVTGKITRVTPVP